MKFSKNGIGEFVLIGFFAAIGFSGLNEARAEDLSVKVSEPNVCYSVRMANYQKIKDVLDSYEGDELTEALADERITEEFLFQNKQFEKRACLGMEAYVVQHNAMITEMQKGRDLGMNTKPCEDEKHYHAFAIKQDGEAKRYPEKAKEREAELRAAFGIPVKSETKVVALECLGDAVASASPTSSETVGGSGSSN
jgi:hypothetical protein